MQRTKKKPRSSFTQAGFVAEPHRATRLSHRSGLCNTLRGQFWLSVEKEGERERRKRVHVIVGFFCCVCCCCCWCTLKSSAKRKLTFFGVAKKYCYKTPSKISSFLFLGFLHSFARFRLRSRRWQTGSLSDHGLLRRRRRVKPPLPSLLRSFFSLFFPFRVCAITDFF